MSVNTPKLYIESEYRFSPTLKGADILKSLTNLEFLLPSVPIANGRSDKNSVAISVRFLH